jgi:hypothetical protein
MEIKREMQTTLSNKFFARFCPDPTVMFDLGEMYAEFNAKYFNGELPLADVKVHVDENGEEWRSYPNLKWDGKFKKLWGQYKANGRGTGKIKIALQAAMDPVQVRSTLLHEMLHAYLDLTGRDDGIKGHGPNFIAEAKRINELCEANNFAYRINFFDIAVTKEQPEVECDLLKTTIYCGKDLDVARQMRTILNAAFDSKYEYAQ